MPLRTSTTRLPAALREQIDKESEKGTRRKGHRLSVNRKEARKQARQEQKQRKAHHFLQAKAVNSNGSLKRPALHQPEDEPLKKKARQEEPPKEALSLPAKQPTKTKEKTSAHRREVSLQPDLPSQNEDPEDARIAWLEARLATESKKRGKKSTAYGDGLDDLMADLDRIIPSFSKSSSKKPGSMVEGGSVQTLRALDEDDDKDTDEGSEASGDDTFSEFAGFSSHRLGDTESPEDLPKPEVKQPMTPADGDASAGLPSGSGYVPPHLRAAPTEDTERLAALSRQMKGLLNRLTEQNIASIVASFEETFRKHPRHDVSTTLTRLMIDGISSHSSHLDSFVVIYASLVASLHKLIGVDFAAHFIQSLIEAYEQHYRVLRGDDDTMETVDEQEGKNCLNLVVLLSELYNFQVVSCVLIYDVLRGLLDKLYEFDVELLLKIVRNSGQQLRQDDPSALKDIVELVQTKMISKDKSAISSRTNFMIETLTNLKNNKLKRSANPDGHAESVDRMKKFLSNLGKKHHVMAHEPLRVTLDDLHSADKKGKWWIVGAAWSGDPLVDRIRAEDQKAETPATHPADSLLKLARKQGMNTDVRRSIFVVLMSSDDYFDACERLSQLNLTETQQREILRVILHCLGNEKAYNPYYTLVVQQLCQTSHSHKITLQFCLWDILRDMGERSVGGAEIVKNLQDQDISVASDEKVSPAKRTNIARAYAWWIAKGFCQLTILKPVDFTILRPQTTDFFRILFWQLFISSQVSSPAIGLDASAATFLADAQDRQAIEEVFDKALRLPVLAQGLTFFLNTALGGDNGPRNETVSRTIKWAKDVAVETLRSGTRIQ